MGNHQYIQCAVDGFEDLYGEELTNQQRQNLIEACEYGEISLGVDADLATDALMVWGDYTGDMERALDSVVYLKNLLHNFAGGYEDLEDFLAMVYLEKLGITDEITGSYVTWFTDLKAFRRHLEMEGWLFAPNSDGSITYVFSA